jgi:hypothetical protein
VDGGRLITLQMETWETKAKGEKSKKKLRNKFPSL